MAGDDRDPDITEQASLNALDHAIQAAKAGQRLSERPPAPTVGLSSGMRAGGELIGGILGGVIFGACADWMFDISPIGLVIGTILGVGAGFYGVYRATL